ncbi:hypothetical protein [Paenibacillus beijingensis]|uniref:Heparinase n=1 Tax=Paenibacillus beijingensis TaxID=1126833 RepID=A0A0D5NG91_9BACL|nr:hypothetical protein [Paenibacillus beijingensis]AJY74276.1 hypothetical protein VN24_06380 [Paenibacillus beijingensis]
MEAMTDHHRLIEKLKSLEDQYNPEVQLLRVPFSSPGYHTTIKQADFVHATYPSAVYAVALLDSEIPELEERACSILGKLIQLQDTNPKRDTFGIWSWFYEEPLSQMSPPDWNWADFIGKNLALVLSRHGGKLPESLESGVRQAVCNAADAIIKRNVGPNYTNISIMGSFVTLIAGELLGREDYTGYGLQRLETFLAYTRKLNTFQEYNSPTYALISILELSKLHAETKLERVKTVCLELLDIAWGMVAAHYHPPTRQWAGPHTRSYSTLLQPYAQSFLQIATAGAASFLSSDRLEYSTEWFKSGIRCPMRFLPYFRTPEECTVRDMYFKDEQKEVEKWATTYMNPRYTLGSFSREIMWNQCRSLVAYFDNGGEVTYLHMRFLNDGYDLSSALLTCDQMEGNALFGLTLLTNGGNTHPSLDKTGGSITSSDLRIRFEIGGSLHHVESERSDSETVHLRIGDMQAAVRSVYGAFDEEAGDESGKPKDPPDEGVKLRWEVTEQDGILAADYVIYAGAERTFHFSRMEKAAFLFMLSIGETASVPEVMLTHEPDRLTAESAVPGKKLSISLDVRPGPDKLGG